jgi:PAS domain S-box-containing protein
MLKKKPLLIIAEDGITQALQLQYTLEDFDYRVKVARNGEEVLKLLEEETPDLIITDVMMPKIDGFKLCTIIKSDEKTKSIPVILLTSLTHPKDVIRGLVVGADNYIPKPYKNERLKAIIDKTLNGKTRSKSQPKKLVIDIDYEGHSFKFNSNIERIINFLITTYETSHQNYTTLSSTQKELYDLNHTLEQLVTSSTVKLISEIKEKERNQKIISEITDNMLDMVFKTDINGLIQWASPSHEKNIGYKPFELVNRSMFELVNPRDREMVIQYHNAGVNDKIEIHFKYRVEHAKGHYLWLSVKGNPIVDERSVMTGYVFGAHDITRQVNSEIELRKAKEKAESETKMKSTFLSEMSHEIRTPMNSIIGFAELLKDTGFDEIEKMEFIQNITRNGENLLNLINDIIDISRVESGQLKINKKDCCLDTLMENIFSVHIKEIEFKEKPIKLKWVCNKNSSCKVLTDGTRLQQILHNLIGNAIKFTEKGVIEFGYRVSANNEIEFFVIDTGIGISSENQKRIFDPYEQLKEALAINRTGKGLGLAISRKLAELLGGRIWVKSLKGRGSSFYFTIPYEKPISDNECNDENKTLSGDSKSESSLVLLIVEDNIPNFNYLKTIFKRSPATIIWAKDGEEAVQLCEKNKSINMVLMDINLPKLNGLEATKKIKKKRKKLPVIALTAYALMAERQHCLDAGCDDYLTKPIKPDVLLSFVNDFQRKYNIN